MYLRHGLTCSLIVVSLRINGCTPHNDPLEGWKGGTFSVMPVPEVIKQDARAYFQPMPAYERGESENSYTVEYVEVGTGQHAVILSLPRMVNCGPLL